MTTSVLSSLKVIARPKIEPKPPVLGKRLRLIEKLEQQKEMAVCMIENRRFEAFRDKKVKNPETGEVTVQRRPTSVRPWYYDSDDHYYLEVKVNNKPIDIQKGKPAIDVGDKAKLPEVIDTIIKATESGELDDFLLKPAVPKKAKQ
ncbi:MULTISPECIES: DUF6641 family protein [Alteromonas]|uniref:DUF6641 family protein n=1 Tax=Alteromonas TaxID=226 RepID=UPI000C309F22|nr:MULTISPECIES: DUF6641 family protein [Alteromonas]AUC89424.1 hypothetical protein CW735_15515 [Alteromonas sp. MB-3u-76]MAD44307.1 hypothetical protein [Oceanospirillaceae bacterium]|tara:strand:- start:6589 stop:7026 length:438 start_codon:yes stop_codon:yes gene_type:complete